MKIFLPLIFAITAVGCGVTQEASETKSYVYKGNRWSNPAAIPVCWDNPGSVSDEIRNDVRQKIIDEYHSKTNLRFVRWDNCKPGDNNTQSIRIHFAGTHDWGSEGGFSGGGGFSWLGAITGSHNGYGISTMVLYVGKQGQYPAQGHPFRDFARNTTRLTAVHEFGHAVGLEHEHERGDAPKCGDTKGIGRNAGDHVFVGKYDPASIMNYCFDRNLNSESLSDGDVAGINFLYPYIAEQPKDLNGEFYLKAKHSNKCVDVADGSKNDGAQVRQWGCNGTVAQKFRFLPAKDGTYFVQNVNSGKCIDLKTHVATEGVKFHQWSCHQGDSQRFRVRPSADGFQMMQSALTSRCVDVEFGEARDGTGIHQWSCSVDSTAQNFAFVRVQ